MKTLETLSCQLVKQLTERNLKIVFAESCSGGLLAASISSVPGASACFAGSAVTYRDEVKAGWLNVCEKILREKSAVCREVAVQMAEGVLRTTPSASIGVATTGYLGPNSPAGQDGTAFIAISALFNGEPNTICKHISLTATKRPERQQEVVQLALQWVVTYFETAKT